MVAVVESSSASSALRPASEPAANALRHGMTATRFVAPEQEARRRAIHAELVSIYVPASREELHCVDELALARAQLFDIEAAAWQRFEWEKSHARERFDRRMLDQFRGDLAAWRAEPRLWLDILAMTYPGACHLERLWADLAEILANPGSVCPLDLIRDAIAAVRSPFDVDHIRPEGQWILQRHLALAADPGAEIDRWIRLMADEDDELRHDRRAWAQRILGHAPDPAASRQELLAKAIAERDRWALQVKDLRCNYETDLDRAARMAVGLVPADEKSMKESRLALRYLTAARNRVDKLERRLDALRRLRPLRSVRQSAAAEPECQPDRSGQESKVSRILAEIAATHAECEALEAKIAQAEAEKAARRSSQAIRPSDRHDRRPSAQASPSDHAPSRTLTATDSGSTEVPRTRPDPAGIARTYRKRTDRR